MKSFSALFICALILLGSRCSVDSLAVGHESDLTDNMVEDSGALEGNDEHDANEAEMEASHELDEALDHHEEDEELESDQSDQSGQSEESAEEHPGVIPSIEVDELMLNPEDPKDELSKFYGISAALKKYENSYIACFEELTDADFIQSELDACTGKKFVHVHNALDYERRKVFSWADKSIQKLMIEYCYEEAGEEISASEACDLFKEDVIQLLWNNVPMVEMIRAHSIKYIRDRAMMNLTVFNHLLERLEPIETEFNNLEAEVELHRENTIHQLKQYIRRRIDDVQDRFNRGEYGQYPRFKIDKIEWTERLVETPDYKLDMSAVGSGMRKLVKESAKPSANRPKRHTKAQKTRNYQKAFISDWADTKNDRNLEKERKQRPLGVNAGENRPNNLLENELSKRKIDRFQFFKKH